MSQNAQQKSLGRVAKEVAVAMQIPFSLVVPIFLAGGIGYLVDRWLHTKFIFMIVFGIIGFGIGIREVLKLASAAENKNGQ